MYMSVCTQSTAVILFCQSIEEIICVIYEIQSTSSGPWDNQNPTTQPIPEISSSHGRNKGRKEKPV